jgi:hypothetical protein
MRGWHAVQQHSSIVLLVLTVGSYMAFLLLKNLLQLQVYLLNRLLGLFMYGCRKDFIDWSEYLYAQSKWPSVFPIHSILALRVAICNENVTNAIYRAAWVENKEIAQPAVLFEVSLLGQNRFCSKIGEQAGNSWLFSLCYWFVAPQYM